MLAGRFGVLVVGTIAGKRREAIADRQDARTTQVAGLLGFEVDDVSSGSAAMLVVVVTP
jgi:hypothetical protein